MSNRESEVEITVEELDRICQAGSEISVIPNGPLRLFDKVDEVVKFGSSNEADIVGFIRTEGNLKRATDIFDNHFIGRPVMPGMTLMDQFFQLAGLFAYSHGVRGNGFALEFGSGKFFRPITPETKKITFEVDIVRFHVGKLRTKVKGIGRVFADGELAAKPLEIEVFIQSRTE